MKIIKNNINKILFGILTIALATSCQNDGFDEYEQVVTPSVKMNGEWFIDISDASGDVLVQHAKHRTYDTNAGDNTMYINDNKLGWWLKGTVNVDTKNLTFSAPDQPNLNDPGSTFTITEGKILRGAGHSKTGAVTDSIYFKGEFSYDKGNILTFAGHKRTGFEEDEY